MHSGKQGIKGLVRLPDQVMAEFTPVAWTKVMSIHCLPSREIDFAPEDDFHAVGLAALPLLIGLTPNACRSTFLSQRAVCFESLEQTCAKVFAQASSFFAAFTPTSSMERHEEEYGAQ